MYSVFYSKYPAFMNLLEKAGLYNAKLYDFPFLIKGELYTIFVPSDQALADYRADTLPKEELAAFLRYHFIKGEKIFTDNKKPAKQYETLRKDESSTQYTTYFSTINIRPGPDVIDILDKNGNLYISIPEKEGKTNIMIAYDLDPESDDETDFIITGVVHQIDTVLIKQ